MRVRGVSSVAAIAGYSFEKSSERP
jgi:hypothetical protein